MVKCRSPRYPIGHPEEWISLKAGSRRCGPYTRHSFIPAMRLTVPRWPRGETRLDIQPTLNIRNRKRLAEMWAFLRQRNIYSLCQSSVWAFTQGKKLRPQPSIVPCTESTTFHRTYLPLATATNNTVTVFHGSKIVGPDVIWMLPGRWVTDNTFAQTQSHSQLC